jgi:hypothetical protein
VSKNLERARALLRLATDPATTEAEARTAALQCCMIIRAADLVLSEAHGAAPPGPVRPGAGPRYSSMSIFMDELFASWVTEAHASRASRRRPARPPPPPPRPVDPNDVQARIEEMFVQLRARAPEASEAVLRRAAVAAVHEEMLRERVSAGGRRP